MALYQGYHPESPNEAQIAQASILLSHAIEG
jgi:hypothetical protein